MIKINQKSDNPLSLKTECLILPCPEEKKPSGTLKIIDEALNGAISAAFKNKRFEGKPNQTLLFNSTGSLKADNLLLVGVGKTKDLTTEIICKASASASKLAEGSNFKSVSIYLNDSCFDKIAKGSLYGKLAEAVADGAGLAQSYFQNYKSQN